MEFGGHKHFIETNRDKAGYFDWLFSKGTNYTCYVQYIEGLNEQDSLNNKINDFRTVIYALSRPFSFNFFYFTLLIFILHKFNFKKPVMKIVLYHYILRCAGNIIDKLGDLMPRYYANTMTDDGYTCKIDSSITEMHPLKFVITRQAATILWYVGEIIADWYPLLRTKAVARGEKYLIYGYISCGIFNLSKVILIIFHFTLKPNELYQNDGTYNQKRVSEFYNIYWVIQLIIIYSSFLYDFTIFFVLKKKLSQMVQMEFGFLKKFRNISEFRIIVAVVVSLLSLPIVTVTIIIKYYYIISKDYDKLDFNFDEIRKLIANVQYYMIFIDQILLLRSVNDTSSNSSSLKDSSNKQNSYKSFQIMKPNNNTTYKPYLDNLKNYSITENSKPYYENLKNFNSTENSYNEISSPSFYEKNINYNNNKYKYSSRNEDYGGIPKEWNMQYNN